MDPEKKSLNFIFPTKYVIPKSLKFSHWPSKGSENPIIYRVLYIQELVGLGISEPSTIGLALKG